LYLDLKSRLSQGNLPLNKEALLKMARVSGFLQAKDKIHSRESSPTNNKGFHRNSENLFDSTSFSSSLGHIHHSNSIVSEKIEEKFDEDALSPMKKNKNSGSFLENFDSSGSSPSFSPNTSEKKGEITQKKIALKIANDLQNFI
jgi:hypothetical protein